METTKSKTENAKVMVSLKDLCKELKADRRDARERLRLAVKDTKKFPNLGKSHQPGATWAWADGSPELKEARAVINS